MLNLHDMEKSDTLCDRLFRDQTNVARFFTMMVIHCERKSRRSAMT
tara:strand:+ start:255 stop:392 length:138 start_codon:yes stop_codon:yes gene_type:complete